MSEYVQFMNKQKPSKRSLIRYSAAGFRPASKKQNCNCYLSNLLILTHFVHHIDAGFPHFIPQSQGEHRGSASGDHRSGQGAAFPALLLAFLLGIHEELPKAKPLFQAV